jgi:hypothetical protein
LREVELTDFEIAKLLSSPTNLYNSNAKQAMLSRVRVLEVQSPRESVPDHQTGPKYQVEKNEDSEHVSLELPSLLEERNMQTSLSDTLCGYQCSYITAYNLELHLCMVYLSTGNKGRKAC